MSKYTIKLEQLISSEVFGDIVLTIQYDFEGAKIISVQGEKITPELNSQLSPILNIFNFCLTKNIPASEVVKQMDIPANPTQFYKLLTLILDTVQQAPAKIQELKQSEVINIDPEILMHLR
jgi:hypothetical protein